MRTVNNRIATPVVRPKARSGMSLLEVILSMTLMTLVMVPMLSMMMVSNRIWTKFQTGHNSVTDRDSILRSITSRIGASHALLTVTQNSIEVLSASSGTIRISQVGDRMQVDTLGSTQLLYEGPLRISFALAQDNADSHVGQVVAVTITTNDSSDTTATTNLSGFSQSLVRIAKPLRAGTLSPST